MPASDFVAHCVELLSPAGRVRVRRMFGGHGLYVDELFVAILTGERLYLKATPEGAVQFESAGGAAFTYARAGRSASLGFWTPPAEAMDSPELMRPWVRLALQAALAARAATAPSPASRRRR